MTLAAAILFFSFSFTSTDLRLEAQSAPQADSSVSAPATAQQSPSSQTPAASKPDSAHASPAAGNKPKESMGPKKQPKKKVVSEGKCDPASASSNGAQSNTTRASPQTGSAPGASTPGTQKNCPPTKIIVHQGGITEQSIQLAGGSSGGEATGKRASTNQMLTVTEENLKKAAAIQLSTAQQNSVSQIRQFVDESKKALKAADFERAQTLAWKAKVLSDDLLSPKN